MGGFAGGARPESPASRPFNDSLALPHSSESKKRGLSTHPVDESKSDLSVLRRELVKQIGSKTFYWRNDRYVDSEITKQLTENAKEVIRFSDAYFELLLELDEADKSYLAEDADMLVVIDGKSYLIKQAETQTENTETSKQKKKSPKQP